MAEIRQKVLASKPFANPQETKKKVESITHTQKLEEASDVEPDSDNGSDNEEFDNIIAAIPVTDRTGLRKLDKEKGA